jgi:hypothetical protein
VLRLEGIGFETKMTDNKAFCQEMIDFCDELTGSSVLKKKLFQMFNRLGCRLKSEKSNAASYVYLCEMAFKLSVLAFEQSKDLPDCIRARMLLNTSNYWVFKYLEMHKIEDTKEGGGSD